MYKCSEDCIVECDFCIYCIHEKLIRNGKIYDSEPVGCTKHDTLRPCNDFECFRCKETGVRIYDILRHDTVRQQET